jgi:HlyD family secretion protein
MKGKRRLVPIVLVLLATVAFFTWRSRHGGRDREVDSGTVEATEAQLGFTVTGRIDSIVVQEGDLVRSGQLLAGLDRSERQARREQAAAQLAAASATLEEFERGSRREEVSQARAGRDAARDRASDAERDLERTRKLHEGGAVSQESFDKASMAVDVAHSQLRQAEDQLRLLEIGPRRERIEAQRAQVAQAEAALREHDAALANMVLRAPFDGIVTVRHREPGEIVPSGSPVLTVMNRDDRWVRIYVREDRIAAVKIGQNASIRTDTDPAKSYRGAVTFIASQAEFTPKSVQTTAERVKLVYAVKVRITEDPTYDLKPGMPADVRLEGGA